MLKNLIASANGKQTRLNCGFMLFLTTSDHTITIQMHLILFSIKAY